MKQISLALICIACLATAGCATEGETQSSSTSRCNIDGTAWAVGKPANEANGRKLFQQSGAGLWRIITPDKAVLADHRDDRLNVHVDASNLITSVDCG